MANNKPPKQTGARASQQIDETKTASENVDAKVDAATEDAKTGRTVHHFQGNIPKTITFGWCNANEGAINDTYHASNAAYGEKRQNYEFAKRNGRNLTKAMAEFEQAYDDHINGEAYKLRKAMNFLTENPKAVGSLDEITELRIKSA